MAYRAGILSDRGNIREKNEDSVLFCQAVCGKKNALLAAVADGMGGLSHGELASRLAVEELKLWWEGQFLTDGEQSMPELKDTLCFVTERIHARIREEAQKQHADMGSTLSLLLLREREYCIIQVGDSRIYSLRGHTLKQLTTDQTWCQGEVEAGRMTKEEAALHSKRHVLNNALGSPKQFFVKSSMGTANSKERFLLCSDGYYTYLKEKELFGGLFRGSPQKQLERSFERIKKGKAEDNLSAILIAL